MCPRRFARFKQQAVALAFVEVPATFTSGEQPGVKVTSEQRQPNPNSPLFEIR